MRRRARTAYDDDWLAVFDPGERDHVCDGIAAGDAPALLGGLRRNLIAPVRRAIDDDGYDPARADHAAALRLVEVAENIARDAELGGTVDELAETLRRYWGEYALMRAAARMYVDLPREAAAAARRSDTNTRNARGERPDRQKLPPVEQTVAYLSARKDAGHSRRDARSAFRAAHMRVASRTAIDTLLRVACGQIPGWDN